MFEAPDRVVIDLPADGPAYLTVVVDTEESFDWTRPLSRDNTQVDGFDAQDAAHDIFDRFAIVPTYVIE